MNLLSPNKTIFWLNIRNIIATVLVAAGVSACDLGAGNTNVSPIANAGKDTRVSITPEQETSGDSILLPLNAGKSRDNDGRIVAFFWEVIYVNDLNLEPLIEIIEPTQALTDFSIPARSARYRLQLTITDDEGDTDIDVIEILVGNIQTVDPEVATVSANADQNVVSNETVYLTATVENFSDEVSYEWRRISEMELGRELFDKKTDVANFVAPEVTEPRQYVFEVTAYTQTQAAKTTTRVTVSPNLAAIPNIIPTANAGADQVAKPGELVILKGLGSDIDGSVDRFNWTQTKGAIRVNLLNETTEQANFIAPEVTTLTALSFSLQVYDDDGDFGEDTAIISIKPNPAPPSNSAPFAQAGPNKTVNENSTVSLNGTASDTDGSIASQTWLQIDGPTVTLLTPDSLNSSFTSPAVNQPITLTFQLTVTDNLGATGVDITVVTVTPSSVNIPPTANAGVDQTVSEGATVTITGSGNDTDGSIVSYLWSQAPGNTPSVTLKAADTNTISFIAPSVAQVTVISLQLRVTDNRDAAFTDAINITVNPIPNATPISNAGIDQFVNEGDQVLLIGNGSDSDGTIASFQWNIISGPRVSILSSTSASTSFTAPAVLQPSVLTLELVVTDNSGASASDTMLVSIIPNNLPPTAMAGVDRSVLSGALVQLNGSGSDTDGSIASYQWSQMAGPTIALSTPLAANTTFTAPNLSQASTITLQLSVTDNAGASGTDTILISVQPSNIPPVANARADRVATSGDVISINGIGSDNDGSVVGFAWSQLSGPLLNIVNPNQSTLTFTAPAVTQTSTVTLQLTVTDNSGSTGSDVVDIVINPGNLPPTASAGTNKSAFSGDLVTITGIGSDADGSIISYRWINFAGPAALLLNANTDTVSFTAPAVTTATTLTLQLTVTDDKNAFATATVDIIVSPTSNILPTANAGLDQSINSGANLTVSGSGSDSDGSIVSYLWTITSAQSVTLNNANTRSTSFTAPTVTQTTTMTLLLTVTDNLGATATDSMIVTILVGNNASPIANAGIDKSVGSGASVSITGLGNDPDGTIASYLWAQTSGPSVNLGNVNLATVSFVAPVVTQNSVITLQLTVTDNLGATASDIMLLSVILGANVLPVANAGLDQSINSGNSITLIGTGSDSDGNITRYLWTQFTGPAIALTGANTASVTFTAPTVNQNTDISFRLTVTDNVGATASDVVLVTVLGSANVLPVANAGADRTVISNSSISIIGSGTDSDGNIASMLWTQTAGPTVVLNNANSATVSFTAPSVTLNTSITLRLTVTDNLGSAGTDTMLVTVLPPGNVLPIANAGLDRTVASSGTISITGSGTDSDGSIVSLQWAQTNGPTVQLSNANTATVSFSAPIVTVDTAITLELTVTDNSNATATDIVIVSVLASNNILPIANAGADRFVTSGNAVSMTGSGTDSDGTITAYSWTQTSGPAVNIGNATSANLLFTAPTVTVSTGITLKLTVTDNGGASASDIVILTVTPISNAPPVANAGSDQNVTTGANVTLIGSGSDIDGTISSYRWIQLGGPAVTLMNAATATTTFVAPTDITVATQFTFQLTVTDNGGATGNNVVIVTVAPPGANIAPVADAGLAKTVISGGTLSITGTGTDSDGSIASYLWSQTSGQLVTLNGLTTATVSFTAPTVTASTIMTLQLLVTDDLGATGIASVIITVSPSNNVLPIALAGVDQTVNEAVTVTLTGSGTDSDGTITAYNWTQISGPTVTLINANTSTLSFVAAQVTSLSRIVLQLTVTDNMGATATDQVNVNVNPVNNAPLANAGLDLTVDEQSTVVITGSATDIDGTINAYSWTQINGPTVTLTGANTAVTTFTAPTVTVITTLTLQLTATDNSGATGSDTVIIIVNPLNTLPIANAGPDQAVSQGNNVVLVGSGTDSDGTIASYAWNQTAGSPAVTLVNPNIATASFIAPTVTIPSTITFELTVTDNGGATATDIVLVTINPGNVPPIADAGPGMNVDSGATVNMSGLASSDPDGTIVGYQWVQIGAAVPVTLINRNTATPQFIAPIISQDPAILFFQLTVTDNLGATGSTNVFVSTFPPTTLSGRISTSVNNIVDSDVNNSVTTPISNNTTVTAQGINNPVVLGGYVNQARSGVAGNSFVNGDTSDIFHISLSANQSITVYVGHPITGVNELGLELLNLQGQVVAASLSGTAIETVTATLAADYFIRVTAQVGASNYILTVGAAPLQVQSTGWSLSDDFIAGDIIVEFKTGGLALQNSLTAKANIINLQGKAGAIGRSMLMGLNKTNKAGAFARLAVGKLKRVSAMSSLQSKLDTLIAAAALRQRPDIKSVRLNYRYYINQFPNDPNYDIQWHYPNINLPLAWDVTTGSSNVIVAVIDTGVLLDHPDLSQAGKLVPGYDFIRSDANSNDGQPGIDPDPYDVGDGGGQVASSFHGTHVSGTIAASSNNGIGVAGVSWGAKIMPLRTVGLNGGSSYDIEQAILFAAGLANDSGTVPAQKADIINLSLGGPTNSIIAPAAYSRARAAGVIIVASAGNSASSAPSAPAAYNGVVSVSATTISKQLAGYSNFGSTIDLAAPGGSSGDLNGDGFQDRIFSTGGNDTSGTIRFNYNLKMGTSMAAPHVAGVIALMKSVFPAMTPDDFDNMLFRGDLTQDLGPIGRDDSFGYGLIDAAKAVLAAQTAGGTLPPPVQPPILSVSPITINYGVGLVSSDILIQNIGAGTLSIASITNTANGWLNIAPLSVDASGLGTYSVTINRLGLADGIYAAGINISSLNNGSVTVTINMQVSSNTQQVNAGPQYIELLDANTSTLVKVLQINPSNGFYDFNFSNVLIGQYTIRSGSDLDNDSLICELGESCGAYPFLGGVGANVINVNGDSPSIINLDFETGFRVTLPSQ